jgi:Uma2 family endonuclease
MAVGISLPESPPQVVQDDLAAAASPAPVVVPGDGLYELVDGQIVEKPVGARQSAIGGTLDQFLGAFARTNRLGRVIPEIVYRLDKAKDLQRRPDVSFVSDARWPFRRLPPDVGVWDLIPDLAIEIISPSNSADEVQEKRLEYFQAGVRGVWVVYPKQREVHVFTSPTTVNIITAEQELDGGDLLPGFRLPLATLFEDEPE